jgi:hypothetical protein
VAASRGTEVDATAVILESSSRPPASHFAAGSARGADERIAAAIA